MGVSWQQRLRGMPDLSLAIAPVERFAAENLTQSTYNSSGKYPREKQKRNMSFALVDSHDLTMSTSGPCGKLYLKVESGHTPCGLSLME
jgi:hypothetical protein